MRAVEAASMNSRNVGRWMRTLLPMRAAMSLPPLT